MIFAATGLLLLTVMSLGVAQSVQESTCGGVCSNDGYPTRNGTCPGDCKWCVGPENDNNTCKNNACGAFCFHDSDCAGSSVCSKCNGLTDQCSTPLTCGQECTRRTTGNYETVCDPTIGGCGYCYDTGSNLAVCTPLAIDCGAACTNSSDCQGSCDRCVFGQCSAGQNCGDKCQKNDDCSAAACTVCGTDGICGAGIACGGTCSSGMFCNPTCAMCYGNQCVGCPQGNPCADSCATLPYCTCVLGDHCVLSQGATGDRRDVREVTRRVVEEQVRKLAQKPAEAAGRRGP